MNSDIEVNNEFANLVIDHFGTVACANICENNQEAVFQAAIEGVASNVGMEEELKWMRTLNWHSIAVIVWSKVKGLKQVRNN